MSFSSGLWPLRWIAFICALGASCAGQDSYSLEIQIEGSGSVRTDSGHECSSSCILEGLNPSITLVSFPATEWTFASWSAPCPTGEPSCTISTKDTRVIKATFAPSIHSLEIRRSGTGEGRVVSTDGQIDCGSTCDVTGPEAFTLTLAAEASLGSTFKGWSGACNGLDSCDVTVFGRTELEARFERNDFAILTVTRSGAGEGRVISVPDGIDCGEICAREFLNGTTVTLTASAASNSIFTGWKGGCYGVSPTCTVNVAQGTSVDATFEPAEQLLVQVVGTGTGTVRVQGHPEPCADSCLIKFPRGTQMYLDQEKNPDSAFAGWSDDCSGFARCDVELDGPRTVTANFVNVFKFGRLISSSGTVPQRGYEIALDDAGDVFVAGDFQTHPFAPVDFGGGPVFSQGQADNFLARYDFTAGYKWAVTLGGTGAEYPPTGIAVDELGSVYLSGMFQGTADFGTGVVASAGNMDGFLSKFDANGNAVWSKTFGGYAPDHALGVATVPGGDVVVVGSMSSPIDFGGGMLVPAGASSGFLANYDSSGTHLWSQVLVGPEAGIGDVAVDSEGRIAVSGAFWDSTTIGNTSYIGPPNAQQAFVARLSNNGAVDWSVHLRTSDQIHSTQIATDGAGNVWVAGTFRTDIELCGVTHGPNLVTGAFIAMFDSTGACKWAHSFIDSTISPEPLLYVGGLVAGADLHSTVSLGFSRGLDVGAGRYLAVPSHQLNVLLAQFDGNGTLVWSRAREGAAIPEAVARNKNGQFALIGHLYGTVDFGTGIPVTANSADAFFFTFEP